MTLDARVEPLERVVDECARVIFAGGAIVLPNDTSYCLACDPYRCGVATEPLELLIASPAEFLEYARSNPLALLASKRLLPGPVTLIISKPAFLAPDVAPGAATIGVRVPDEPVARAILERAGPLAAVAVTNGAAERADLTVENGPTRYEREATVVDLTGRHARIVREGALEPERLAGLLR